MRNSPRPLWGSTNPFIINEKPARCSWFLPIALLGTLTPALATPSAKSVGKAPVEATSTNSGNGIYVLGDDGGVVSLPARKSPTPPSRKMVSEKVTKATKKSDVNQLLVRFCRSYLGYKLGNGQCSELAMIGLPAVGAQCDLNHQWGRPVCNYGAMGGRQFIQLGEAGKLLQKPHRVNVRPGDIIQYEGVKFEQRYSDGRYTFQSYPHHTSVIESVSRDGRTYKVLEQNVNNTQFIVETVVHLPDLTEGVLHITRPLPR